MNAEVTPAAAAAQDHPKSQGTPGPLPLVFDLEVRLNPDEVGGWGHAERMGLAVAVTIPFDPARPKAEPGPHFWTQAEAGALVEALESAPWVLGFNHVRFDYAVLAGVVGRPVGQRWNVDLSRILPGVSLDAAAVATLGRGKGLDSAQIPQMWRLGYCEAVRHECRRHVELTRDLYSFIRRHGGLYTAPRQWRRVSPRKLLPRDAKGRERLGGVA